MDIIDHITDLELRLLELRVQAATCRPQQSSARFCTECGNTIPARRRKTLPGVQRCVGCQEVQEKHQRDFGGRL